jgi:hypothetical protein
MARAATRGARAQAAQTRRVGRAGRSVSRCAHGANPAARRNAAGS